MGTTGEMARPAQVDRTLAAAPQSVAYARALIDTVEPALPPDVRQRARLLMSEVVTNAIRHGAGTAVRVQIRRERGRLVVEVRDDGEGFEPDPSRPDPSQGSGWGVHLVATLAQEWGVDADGGTRVWFALDVADEELHAVALQHHRPGGLSAAV